MAINTLSNPSQLGQNGSRFYSFAKQPVMIETQFQVASTDAGGLGLINLKGQGVNTAFMYTNQTAGTGPNGVVNPLTANSSKGFIWIQLANNYKNILSVQGYLVSPATGATINVDASDAALTIGTPYIINSLGTSTTADWVAVGLPIGLTPTVGQNFVAIATGAGTGTGNVKAVGVTGTSQLEIVGTAPVQSFFPTPTGGISPNVGAWLMLQCLSPSTAAPTLTMNSYTPAGTNGTSTITVANGTAGNAVTIATATTLNATGGGTLTTSAATFTGTPATLTGTVGTPATTLSAKNPTDGSLVFLSIYVTAR